MAGEAEPAGLGSGPDADGKAQLKAIADRRIAEMDAKGKDNQNGGAAPRTPDGKFAPKENTQANPVTDKPPAVPNGSKTVDRSFLSDFPEEFRKSFEGLSPAVQEEAAKVLSAEGRKEKDYRQKTMSIAEREKALKDEEEVLRYGRAVQRDPVYSRLVEDEYLRRIGKAPQKPSEKALFDHITATPEEFAAHEEEIKRSAAETAYERFKRDEEAKEQKQAEKVLMAKAAKAAFVDTGDYEPEVVNATYEALVEDGVTLTKDNVVEKLAKWLPAVKAAKAPQVNPAAAAVKTEQVVGASSLARAGGVAPQVNTPPFIQKGEVPKTSDDVSERSKRIQEAVWLANKKRELSGKDLISLGS